jgi:hypothetical protein
MLAAVLSAVLRIHDILVWIRIRIWIRGYMPLANGFGSVKGPFTSFFKDKKSKRSHKRVEIKVCLTKFA